MPRSRSRRRRSHASGRRASPYALRNVQPACILNHLRAGNADIQAGVARMGNDMRPDTLSRNEAKTVWCPIDFGDDPTRPAAIELGRGTEVLIADVTIAAVYSPPWWAPFSDKLYSRRFVGRRTPAGWRWEAQPVSGARDPDDG